MAILASGLNLAKKPASQRPPPGKRKPIFGDDDDDDEEEEAKHGAEAKVFGNRSTGQTSAGVNGSKSNLKTLKPLSDKIGKTGNSLKSSPQKQKSLERCNDLSAKRTSALHAKEAQDIDSSIYDYDGVYDSIHAVPKDVSGIVKVAEKEKKPKYMGNLMAAAEVRKRDQLRAKDVMLAKEREAEGEEFADKEQFVTGAYKRQQAEMRKLEAEEAEREKEAERRKQREGGGMKALYKNLLDRDEQKHQAIMKAVAEKKDQPGVSGQQTPKESNDGAALPKKSEADHTNQLDRESASALEKGAMVNDDGQIVDKRQLLSAGLNAGTAPKARPTDIIRVPGARAARNYNSSSAASDRSRAQESRRFEDQLLKRSTSPDSTQDRAAKSRKIEDELLAAMGSP